MIAFPIHQHESAIGIHVSAHPETPTRLPPHPIPLGCHIALALGAVSHTSNLRLSSILNMVMYMFQCYFLNWCPLSSPHSSTSLFSLSASPLLLCKQVHQYHLSRVHNRKRSGMGGRRGTCKPMADSY